MTVRTTVLHLAGSAETPFYGDLSLVYARAGKRLAAFNHRVALVEPGGRWRLGPTFDDLGPAVTAPAAIAELEDNIDLVVPYMFDISGMTSFRSLFEDVLGVPVVGSTARVNSAAADKAVTKAILNDAGLPVPAGCMPDSIDEYPVVVKPATDDNSRGLTLVENAGDLQAAIAVAAEFGPPLIEQYIDGREIRLAVIETGDDELMVPPMIELHDQLAELARRAHCALGCRDYSLFDLRVDRDGNPFVLEAGLFWTFGEPSMITRMLRSGAPDPDQIIEDLWQRAASRSSRRRQTDAPRVPRFSVPGVGVEPTRRRSGRGV